MRDRQAFMSAAHSELKHHLVNRPVDAALADAAVASGYYLLRSDGKTWIGDSWYGRKAFLGLIPEDAFVSYLNNGSYRINGTELRANPTCYRIKSLAESHVIICTCLRSNRMR